MLPKIELVYNQINVQKTDKSFSLSFKPINCGNSYKLATIRQEFLENLAVIINNNSLIKFISENFFI
jgi:hypothetical protein